MPPSLKRVMVATDFSPTADAAVPFAYALVAAGGEVHLVHVVEHDEAPSPLYSHYTPDELANAQMRKTVIAEVEQRLRTLVPTDAKAASVRTVVGCAIHRLAPAGLIEEAAQRKVDAIVMGSHGRRGLGHLLMGSVAEEVLRGAGLPILIIPRRG